jgi:hypothetical protein
MVGTTPCRRFYKGTEKNPTGYWEPKKFNASLFHVLMYTLARADKNVVYQNLDSVREALIYLMTENQEFIDAIELSTSSVQAVTKRSTCGLALQDIIGIGNIRSWIFDDGCDREGCARRIPPKADLRIGHILSCFFDYRCGWSTPKIDLAGRNVFDDMMGGQDKPVLATGDKGSRLPKTKQAEFITHLQANPHSNYMLAGEPGMGKTHLGFALAYAAVERWSIAWEEDLRLGDQSVFWDTWPRL